MSELCLPLDVEQLAEIGQLRALLRQRRASGLHAPPMRELEAFALFLFLRLFITLGYLARSTNQPGRLTAAGALQLRESLDPLFGDDCDPLSLLEECGLLVRLTSPQPAPHSASAAERGEGGNGWQCALFARLNPQLAGDYQPKHMKGNLMRQVGIALKESSVSAAHQSQVLIKEICRKVLADGQYAFFEPQELDRVNLVILTLDKLFGFKRNRTQFTESLLQAAHAAAVKTGYVTTAVPEELRQFFGWILTHKTSPRVPGTTEQVLADFETLYALSQKA